MSGGVTEEALASAIRYAEARDRNDEDKRKYEDELRRLCTNDAIYAKAMMQARDVLEKQRNKDAN